MTLQEQINIIKELLEATKELNGEFQDGWDDDIEKGEKLLAYLEIKQKEHGEHDRS